MRRPLCRISTLGLLTILCGERTVFCRRAPKYDDARQLCQSGVSMRSAFISPYLLPMVLLLGSNLFMTLAWYGHLRFKEVPLIGVIVASWLIAFVEYCVAVPANRWGSAVYTTAQLKTIQEVITLLVFAGFSIVYLKEPLTLELCDRLWAHCARRVLRPARPAVMQCERRLR